MGFILLIAILLFALVPIILPLVFSEIMDDKNSGKTNDLPRKSSRVIALIFVALISVILIFLALSQDAGNPRFNETFKFIISMLGVLR